MHLTVLVAWMVGIIPVTLIIPGSILDERCDHRRSSFWLCFECELDDLDCFDAHPPNLAAGCDGGYRSPFLIYASVWLTGLDSSEELCIICVSASLKLEIRE